MSEFASTSVATYNVEMSGRPEDIIRNLDKLSSSVGIFCLQEVLEVEGEDFLPDRLCQTLGSNWRSEHYIGDSASEPGILGHGVAIVWNADQYTLKSTKRTALPKMEKLSTAEKLLERALGFAGEPVQRRAISAQFSDNRDETLRVTSLHLDSMGGAANRRIQTAFVLNALTNDEAVDKEIITGDFNTNSIFARSAEVRQLRDLFASHEFHEATAKLDWTMEMFNSEFGGNRPLLQYIMNAIPIQGRQKIDYVWGRGFSSSTAYRVDAAGSDHYPVVATFCN